MATKLNKKILTFFIIILLLITIFSCVMPTPPDPDKKSNKIEKEEINLNNNEESKGSATARTVITQYNYYIDGGDYYQAEFIKSLNNDYKSHRCKIRTSKNYIHLADIQTFNSWDTAGVRIEGYTTSNVSIKVEEEKSADNDTYHAEEYLSLLRIQPGNIKNKSGKIIGETHSIQKKTENSGHWRWLEFDRGYANPVVFGTIVSNNESTPCHVRIKDIESNRCRYKIEEWAYSDGAHEDRIHFVIIEAGIHSMYQKGEDSNAQTVYWEVGTVNSKAQTWLKDEESKKQQILLKSAFVKSKFPLVFTRSQTCNEPTPIVVRNHDVCAIESAGDEYKMRINITLQEENAKNQYHPSETIGYLVVGEVQWNDAKSGIVKSYGNLQVRTNRLCNERGMTIQLKGMSAFWTNWEEGRKYANDAVIEWLIDDLNIRVFRAAMGVRPIDPDGSGELIKPLSGYVDYPDENLEVLYDVVDSCINRGIYVIIDWHVHDALAPKNKAAAKDFFKKVSKKYGKYPNVIFEIWNEPGWVGHKKYDKDGIENDIYVWYKDIKPYCEEMIKIIRDNDSDNNDNVIICPSEMWCQNIHYINFTDYPISKRNIMYTFHFYAGSHIPPGYTEDEALTILGLPRPYEYLPYDLNEKPGKNLDSVVDDLPVFVTEWGASLYDGGQQNTSTDIFALSSSVWLDYLKDHKISWCNWSISDKKEGASFLKPGSSTTGRWNTYSLSDSGNYIRNYFIFQ